MGETDITDLDGALMEKAKESAGAEVELFDLSEMRARQRVADLLSRGEIRHVVDDYEEQLRELYAVRHPSEVYASEFTEKTTAFVEKCKEQPLAKQGHWAYFPWRSCLTHILPEEEYVLVRTARNKNLITAEEQKRFYNATAGIGGLSVGSSIAYALALQGGPKHLKLADMDRLALSNTNRVLAGAENLGLLKVEIAARKIYEINPYVKLELFPDGLNPRNISAFFNGLDIVIDELDTIAVKYLIRQEAKKRGIAVVMGADNGDNAVIDIERYDEDPHLPFFHGRLGDTTYESLANLDKFGIGKTITKHIGPENVTVRMQESLLEMGKTIVSWPQLGGAALVNGAAVAYCVRKILNKQPLEGNRALISLDEKLVPDYFSEDGIARRSAAADVFKKTFGL